MGSGGVAPWTGALLVLLAVVVGAGALLRYRALERRGTPLPPGAGGTRLVGLRCTVVRAHEPGAARGVVVVLGDRWELADAVTGPLPVGAEVVVLAVTGTRLVVAPAPAARGTEPPPNATDPTTRESP